MNKLYEYALVHLEKAKVLIEEVTVPSNDIADPFQPFYAENAPLSPICIATNMGLVYRRTNDTDSAKRVFDEALRKNGSTNDKVQLYHYKGVLRIRMRKLYRYTPYLLPSR